MNGIPLCFYNYIAFLHNVHLTEVAVLQRYPFIQEPLQHSRAIPFKNPEFLGFGAGIKEDLCIRKGRVHAVDALDDV